MDDVTARRAGQPDAAVLAGSRARRRVALGAFAVLWAVLAAGQLAQGNTWMGIAQGLLSLGWLWAWWVSPQPHVRAVTAEELLVRRGLPTRSIDRAQVSDVRPERSAGYGLVLTLRDADPVRLAGTALRFSVAAEQAAALRRWAGLDDTVS